MFNKIDKFGFKGLKIVLNNIHIFINVLQSIQKIANLNFIL